MSKVKKYLELNSAYRNRNLFPNPGKFQVNISQSGTKSQQDALDPISYAYPISQFNFGSTFNGFITCKYTVPSSQIGNTYPVTIANACTNSRIIVSMVGNTHSRDQNYYTGCSIVIIGGSLNGQVRFITSYLYIATIPNSATTTLDYVEIGLNIPFDNLTANQTFNIYIPSDFGDYENLYLFVPSSVNVDNYINNYYVYNYNKADYAQISGFDGQTHIARLKKPQKSGWSVLDYFSIAQEAPSNHGKLPYGVVFQLSSKNTLSTDAGYPETGVNVGTKATPPSIGTGLTVSWTGGVNGELPNNINVYYGGSSYAVGDTILISGAGNGQGIYTISSITQPVGTIVFNFLLDNSYINSFVRVLSTQPNTPDTIQQIVAFYKNIAYVKDTSYIQPLPSISPTVYDVCFFIYQYSTDNVSPFVYTGTIISNNQPTAYYVSLVSLSLPNQPLLTGGRITDYPFVYVEFENVGTSSTGAKNLIYSNNPNANKAVFRVSIQELIYPKTELFTKNTAIEMPQVIVFKQTDDVRITIRLPNGNVFQTVQTDTVSGSVTNFFIQISALFSILKI